MGSVDNTILVWIPVENNYCSSYISYEITVMCSIINITFCNMLIYDVKSYTPYLDFLYEGLDICQSN